MGEAKAKRARLGELLGETRGENFEEFLAETARLRATPGARPDQLDRLRFHELFAAALIEGCRERAGEEATVERDLELIEASAIAAGVAIGVTFLGRLRSPSAEAVALVKDRILQSFSAGLALGARPHTPGT